MVRIQLLAKSLNGEEVTQELINVLSMKLGVTMRDRASVNIVAIHTLKILYPHLLNIGCFHIGTLDLVGDYFKLPQFTELLNSWLSLLNQACAGMRLVS